MSIGTAKQKEIEARVLNTAYCYVTGNYTIRSLAKELGHSKSTVSKDLVERLPKMYPEYINEVAAVLRENKRLASVRGGKSCQEMWKNKRLNGGY